jgi:23S rRNA (guanosine2251-2'-O)-methyltransferase
MKKIASLAGISENTTFSCKVSLLLHDMRSAYNVGSIFRTADAFGAEKIFVSGCTPAPIDRFGRKRADIAKVALGAEESIKWEQVTDGPGILIMKFKKENNAVVIALEQDGKSVDYRNIQNEIVEKMTGELRILLILGNEVEGVSREILDMADRIAEIPMRGKKESLNVSVAAGIALFGMFGGEINA